MICNVLDIFGKVFCLKLFYWLLVMRITFERFSFLFISFDCFDQLSVLCCLVVLSFLSKFSMISSVLGQFWSKKSFFLSKNFVLLFGHENSFQAVFIAL